MKEIISGVVLVVALFGGTLVLKNIHGAVRKVALEKAAQGLPSLVDMNRSIQTFRKEKRGDQSKPVPRE